MTTSRFCGTDCSFLPSEKMQGRTSNARPHVQCRAVTFKAGAERSMQGRTINARPHLQCRTACLPQGRMLKAGLCVQGKTFNASPCAQGWAVRSMQGVRSSQLWPNHLWPKPSLARPSLVKSTILGQIDQNLCFNVLSQFLC